MNYIEYTVRVYTHGDKHWYNKDGNLHREDGPAIIYANGNKCWYKNGYLHREDGPAIVYADGSKFYYLDSKEYSEETFIRKIAEQNNCQNKTISIGGKEYILVPKEDK